MKNNDINEKHAFCQTYVIKSVLLTGKCKEEFLNYYWKNYIEKTRFLKEKSETEEFFNSLYPTFRNALIIDFFDSIGITIDVVPRMNKDKVVFEPNTFCLKYEMTTEDFVQFDKRIDAVISAINFANVIYNENFV